HDAARRGGPAVRDVVLHRPVDDREPRPRDVVPSPVPRRRLVAVQPGGGVEVRCSRSGPGLAVHHRWPSRRQRRAGGCDPGARMRARHAPVFALCVAGLALTACAPDGPIGTTATAPADTGPVVACATPTTSKPAGPATAEPTTPSSPPGP